MDAAAAAPGRRSREELRRDHRRTWQEARTREFEARKREAEAIRAAKRREYLLKEGGVEKVAATTEVVARRPLDHTASSMGYLGDSRAALGHAGWRRREDMVRTMTNFHLTSAVDECFKLVGLSLDDDLEAVDAKIAEDALLRDDPRLAEGFRMLVATKESLQATLRDIDRCEEAERKREWTRRETAREASGRTRVEEYGPSPLEMFKASWKRPPLPWRPFAASTNAAKMAATASTATAAGANEEAAGAKEAADEAEAKQLVGLDHTDLVARTAEQWLDSLDLFEIHGLMSVSSHWKVAARSHPHVFQTISIKAKLRADDEAVARCLALANHGVRVIHLDGLPNITSAGLTLLSQQPHLREVQLLNCEGILGQDLPSCIFGGAPGAGGGLSTGTPDGKDGGGEEGEADDASGKAAKDGHPPSLDVLSIHGCQLVAKDLVELEKCGARTIDVFTCESCNTVALTQVQCVFDCGDKPATCRDCDPTNVCCEECGKHACDGCAEDSWDTCDSCEVFTCRDCAFSSYCSECGKCECFDCHMIIYCTKCSNSLCEECDTKSKSGESEFCNVCMKGLCGDCGAGHMSQCSKCWARSCRSCDDIVLDHSAMDVFCKRCYTSPDMGQWKKTFGYSRATGHRTFEHDLAREARQQRELAGQFGYSPSKE